MLLLLLLALCHLPGQHDQRTHGNRAGIAGGHIGGREFTRSRPEAWSRSGTIANVVRVAGIDIRPRTHYRAGNYVRRESKMEAVLRMRPARRVTPLPVRARQPRRAPRRRR